MIWKEQLLINTFLLTNAKSCIYQSSISDVEILLLDESTANLDDDSKDKIFRRLMIKI